MPLTPLPVFNSPRGAVLYTSGGLPHQVDFRLGAGASKADVEAKANALAPLIAACLPNVDGVTGALYWPLGSDISQTLAVAPVAGSIVGTAFTDRTQSAFASFTGRSSDGRKVRFTVFSTAFGGKDVTREPVTAADTPVRNLYAEVISTTLPLCAIGTQTAVWHSYVNYGWNARYQRKLR